MRSVAILVSTIALVSVVESQKSCYSRDENPYLYFATKTAYEFVKDRARNEELPNCEPKQIWLMARHGTRYPKRSEIADMVRLTEIRNQILRNHEERRDGNLCSEDLDHLKSWSLDVSPVQEQDLTNQGHMDMEFIARRYKSRFSGLLTEEYSPERFIFRHTDRQRTKASAEAFAAGLFGGPEGRIQLPEPIVNDPLIQGYKNCTYWRQEVKENPQTLNEQDLFLNGTLVQDVIKNVSERLGFKYRLTIKQIDGMYDMCRYDKAWLVKELSPWCAVFTKKELQVLEYNEDLKYYYQSSYGNDLNVKLGCPAVKDLIERFSALETETGPKQPSGVFYFTHSTAIQTTLASLGIAKDFPKLLHNNYELMQKREWKTSLVAPFAANVAAIFFKCSRGDKHRVMFYLQEKVVQYDGCEVGLCSWQFIKEKFSKINQCNLNWCRDGGNGSPSLNGAAFLLAASVFAALRSSASL